MNVSAIQAVLSDLVILIQQRSTLKAGLNISLWIDIKTREKSNLQHGKQKPINFCILAVKTQKTHEIKKLLRIPTCC